jgi:hypothetical protein
MRHTNTTRLAVLKKRWEAAKAGKELAPWEYQFIYTYLQIWDATESCRRLNKFADPKHHGWVMMRDPRIRKVLNEHLAMHRITGDEILARLSDQARANLGDYLEIDPDTGKTTIDLRRAQAAHKLGVIKKLNINSVTGMVSHIELTDTQAAMKLVGQYFGMFVDRYVVALHVKEELETALDKLERNLPADTFNQVLQILNSSVDEEGVKMLEGYATMVNE